MNKDNYLETLHSEIHKANLSTEYDLDDDNLVCHQPGWDIYNGHEEFPDDNNIGIEFVRYSAYGDVEILGKRDFVLTFSMEADLAKYVEIVREYRR